MAQHSSERRVRGIGSRDLQSGLVAIARSVPGLLPGSVPGRGSWRLRRDTGIALALTGQVDTADELVAQLDLLTEAGHPSAGLARHVTRAAVALTSGNPQSAVEHLGIALDRRADLGGSHAQLDVLDQTLVHARWRSGDVDGARAEVEERARWVDSHRERRLLERLDDELNLTSH